MIIFRKMRFGTWLFGGSMAMFRCKPPFRKANSWNLNPSYCQMLWGLFISSVPGAFISAACEEQCLQCKRQGTIDGSGAAWRCGLLWIRGCGSSYWLQVSCKWREFIFPKIVLFQYFSHLEVSDTWWHTKRMGEDTCNMHQVLLHIISLHPNGWSYPGLE